MLDNDEHRILDWLEHLWPFIAGISVTLLAIAKLWWYSRQQIKKRVSTLEVLAEHLATKEDIRNCREEVRQTSNGHLKSLYDEMKANNAANNEQHLDILKEITRHH